jgi:hypothetical protein
MNHKLIAERCRTGGSHLYEVAKELRIDPLPLHFLAGNPLEDGRIPFGVFRALSRLLDIGLEDLVEVPVASCVMPRDDLRVEAAIAAVPAGVTRDDLARCFVWPLERVERAIAVLELRLRPSGRRLRRIGWHRYALGPNLSLLSPHEHAELARAVARQRGPIDEESALVLHQVIEGWTQARLYRDVQETIDGLLDKQLLEKRNGNLEPSPDVLFSLGLDEPLT